jgi:hypothetical protein
MRLFPDLNLQNTLANLTLRSLSRTLHSTGNLSQWNRARLYPNSSPVLISKFFWFLPVPRDPSRNLLPLICCGRLFSQEKSLQMENRCILVSAKIVLWMFLLRETSASAHGMLLISVTLSISHLLNLPIHPPFVTHPRLFLMNVP